MKSLITSGILAVSLTLSANTAMAGPTQANPIPNAAQSYRTVRATPFAPGYGASRVAARVYLPNNRLGMDVGQFISGMLGGSLPPQYAQIVRNAVRVSASHGSSGSYRILGLRTTSRRPRPQSTSTTVSHRRPSTPRTRPSSRWTSPFKTWMPAMLRHKRKTTPQTLQQYKPTSTPACEGGA